MCTNWTLSWPGASHCSNYSNYPSLFTPLKVWFITHAPVEIALKNGWKLGPPAHCPSYLRPSWAFLASSSPLKTPSVNIFFRGKHISNFQRKPTKTMVIVVIPLSHYIYILIRNADKSQCFFGLSYIITNVSHSNIPNSSSLAPCWNMDRTISSPTSSQLTIGEKVSRPSFVPWFSWAPIQI